MSRDVERNSDSMWNFSRNRDTWRPARGGRADPLRSDRVRFVWLPAAFLVLISVPTALSEDTPTLPDHTDYHALWTRGAYSEALKALDTVLVEGNPVKPPELIKDRAELRFLTGDVDGAEADLEQLYERRTDIGVQLRLAEIYRYHGKTHEYQASIEEASRLIESWLRYASRRVADDRPEHLLWMGRIAELRGDDAKNVLTGIYKGLMELHPDFVPGFVAAANLAQSKGSYGTASGYYEKALSIDANSQEALAGLAKCYWHSSDERLDATLKRLEELNPNHPGGSAVRVEMLLDANRIQDADQLIERALAINPNQLEFLGLKAAALFLQDQTEEMERIQDRALAFNPLNSAVYRIPGRIASRHYRFREGSELQRKALSVDPDDSDARAYLGLDLLRLGQDEAGQQELQSAFERDPYNVQVYNTLKVLDTLASFKTLTQGPFAIQLPADEADLLGDSALNLLVEEIALLQQKYAIELETPIRVQIFNHHDDFMVRSIGLPGNSGHLGICFGRLITMDSPSARPKGSFDWQSVLWHEFTHVITLQKTRNRMPRWLSEGISVYEEAQHNPGWGMRLDPKYRKLIADGTLPHVSDLELYFTQPKSPEYLMFGYFLAGEFVNHYVASYGQEAMVKALGQIADHVEAIPALASCAGANAERLDKGFQSYLKQRFKAFDNLEAFTTAMVRGLSAQKVHNWAEAEAALREASALYPDYAGENSPQFRLAQVYEAMGRYDDERRALDTELGLDTANLEAWRKLAALGERAADWPAVERAASGAAAVDPFDADLGRLLFRALREQGKNTEALATADRLLLIDSPHADEYKLARIELLMGLDRRDEAKRETVHLLEETPTYWEAQKLLLRLVDRNENNAVQTN